MTVTIFASGSGGNCMLIRSAAANILIDAGISARKLSASLGRCGLSLQDIGGVLITHEHSDHIYGLKPLVVRFGVPAYASKEAAVRIGCAVPELYGMINSIPVGERFSLCGLGITAFPTPHDAPGSVGYRIDDGSVFAVATDMGCVTDAVRDGLRGADAVLIEANHDEDMLRYGPYPPMLKRRILSNEGHLSNACCAELARELASGGTGKIILGHLSRQNNSPEAALSAVARAIDGLGAALYCAPEYGCLELDAGGGPCSR